MAVDEHSADTTRLAQTGNLSSEVADLARPLVESGDTPGIVVGVLLPDRSMRFFAYGVTSHLDDTTPNADTLFAVGSLSKGFLGALAAILVEEGRLSWTDTLGESVPADAPLSSDAKRLTVLQLATHTSGLPRQPLTLDTLRYFANYLFTGQNFYQHLDRDHVFDYLAHFKAPKDTQPHYSNLGYGLLGYLIERKTGASLDTLMREKLFNPLGLTQTSYTPSALPGYAQRARGHAGDQPKFVRRGAPVPDWEFTPLMKGSAGLYSSAKDLLRFAKAHLDSQSHPAHAALADTLRIRFARPKEAAAIAWIVDELHPTLRVTYQVGLVAGYTSYLGLDMERGTAVVVLRNSFHWQDHIGHKLLMRLAYAHDHPVAAQAPRAIANAHQSE